MFKKLPRKRLHPTIPDGPLPPYNSPSYRVATHIQKRLRSKQLLLLHTPILAFKRNKNLKDSLVSSHLQNKTTT
jgi:hypothetical protein